MTKDSPLRWAILAVAVYHLLFGLFMWLFPGTFFEEVGTYGVRNDHYIGDNATFQLAAGIVLLLAVSRPRWRAPALTLLAAWYGLHALNHFIDVNEADSGFMGWSQAILLTAGTALFAWLARASDREASG